MDARASSHLERRLATLEALPAERRWPVAMQGVGAAMALEWSGLLDHGDHQRWMEQFNSVANGQGRIDWDTPTEPRNDDLGTDYRCSINQSGTIVTCNASPAPPQTARELRLTTADGNARSFDLTKALPGETTDARIEYLDGASTPADGVGVAVERFVLAIRGNGHFPLEYAESGISTLGELGLLGAEELARALDRVREAATDRRPVMTRPQRLLYPEPPDCAGIRVGGVILFDDAVSVRWGQLPPEFRPDGKDPWLLLDYESGAVDWMLSDDLETTYHPIAMAAGYGGFFSYPYWTGEQAYVPHVPDGARQLRLTMGERTAVLRL